MFLVYLACVKVYEVGMMCCLYRAVVGVGRACPNGNECGDALTLDLNGM
jgi:hypothetical protein